MRCAIGGLHQAPFCVGVIQLVTSQYEAKVVTFRSTRRWIDKSNKRLEWRRDQGVIQSGLGRTTLIKLLWLRRIHLRLPFRRFVSVSFLFITFCFSPCRTAATSGRSCVYDVETLPSASSGVRCLAAVLPANEVGCVTMATVTSAGSRLILPDSGVTLMIAEGALKSGHAQEHYLAVLREDRYRPKISGRFHFILHSSSVSVSL